MVIRSVLPHIEINMLWLTHTSTWVIFIFSGKIIYQNKPDMFFLKRLGQKFTYSFLKDYIYSEESNPDDIVIGKKIVVQFVMIAKNKKEVIFLSLGDIIFDRCNDVQVA